MLPVNTQSVLSALSGAAGGHRSGVNPYGIGALAVGLIVLIILLITFRKH